MMWSIFWEHWFHIDLVFKNGIRNAPGRLVNAVEHFFGKYVLNLRSFQKWSQKCRFFFCTKKILVTFYCSFFRFLFFGPLSKKGIRNGLGRLVNDVEYFC